MDNCQHKDEYAWWEHDAQGIPLAKVCRKCREKKLCHFRPEILEDYNQIDVDEEIG